MNDQQPISSRGAIARRRWAAAIVLSLASGALPYTISGFAEFTAIVLVPFLWVSILRPNLRSLPLFRQMSLCGAVALLHPFVRLLASSWHDGFNWFVYLLRVEGWYQRQVLMTLGLPVFVAMMSALMLRVLDSTYWRGAAGAARGRKKL